MKEKETSRLSVFLVVLAVCLVYALGGGIRSNYGLMRGAMAASSGVDYAGISFVLAAAQLAFGIMQPVFGAVALKTSNVFVLLCGRGVSVPSGGQLRQRVDRRLGGDCHRRLHPDLVHQRRAVRGGGSVRLPRPDARYPQGIPAEIKHRPASPSGTKQRERHVLNRACLSLFQWSVPCPQL